jgi:hypothetical protein
MSSIIIDPVHPSPSFDFGFDGIEFSDLFSQFDLNGSFDEDTLNKIIEDFISGKGSSGTPGLGSDFNVDFDESSGTISINGEDFGQFDPNIFSSDGDSGFGDSVFEGSNSFANGESGKEDVFTFNLDTDLDSGEIAQIENFNPGEDTIRIKGMDASDKIDFDSDTGILSINDQDLAQLDCDVPPEDSDFELL